MTAGPGDAAAGPTAGSGDVPAGPTAGPGESAATDPPGPASAARVEELRANLAAVRARIAAAAGAAGRDPASITLVAIAKTWPAADAAAISALAVADIGENRDQEARPKIAAVAGLLGPDGPRPVWHFVGQLQRNKARSIGSWARWVHAVDRAVLVGPLAAGAAGAGRTVAVCLQVSLDPPGAGVGRGGVEPAGVARIADLVAASSHLHLAGVMGVAPLGGPARPAFARLRKVSERLRADHPGATAVSAGMSGDLAEAVAEGATHLRVGTALFGPRPRFP